MKWKTNLEVYGHKNLPNRNFCEIFDIVDFKNNFIKIMSKIRLMFRYRDFFRLHEKVKDSFD